MEKIRTKITEIPMKGKVFRWEVNEKGERVKVEKEVTVFKEVDFVSGWLRFGHFLIDTICYYIVEFLIGGLLGVISGVFSLGIDFDSSEFNMASTLMSFLIIHPFFYCFWEYYFQKTPGKWVTQCRVVNEYGERPSFGQILGRSYARSIPFEIFSCLSERGWHDTMSNTYLLKESTLQELRAIIMIDEIGKPVSNEPDETIRPNSFSSQ